MCAVDKRMLFNGKAVSNRLVPTPPNLVICAVDKRVLFNGKAVSNRLEPTPPNYILSLSSALR